jgi:hypothetical protein
LIALNLKAVTTISHLTGHKTTSNWFNKNLAVVENPHTKSIFTRKSPQISAKPSQDPTSTVSIQPSQEHVLESKLSTTSSSSQEKNSPTIATSASFNLSTGWQDPLRRMSYMVLNSRWYPYVLYGTIFLSSLTLAFNPPRHEVR